MTRMAFHLDLNQCTGCGACSLACAIENRLPWGENWRWIETFNERHLPDLPFYHFSLACNHCVDAPCEKSCPALAITRDERTGAVLIDPDHCIGCRYCSWACPYDAPRFSEILGVMRKCTFCNERQLEGLLPACVQQCPTAALGLVDVEDETAAALSESVQGFPRTNAKPSLRFTSLRAGHVLPEMAPSFVPLSLESFAERRVSKISFGREWPLWIFTLLAAVLVGWMAGHAATGVLGHSPGPVRRLVPLPVEFFGPATESRAWLFRLGLGIRIWTPWIFAAGCLLAMMVSGLHLSKKGRAYRAIVNLRHSWLSREIFFFLLFTASSFFYLLMARYAGVDARGSTETAFWNRFVNTVSIVAALTGVAALLSIDRVYTVWGERRLWRHSASAIAMGAVVFALTLDSPALVAALLLVQGILYFSRKMGASPAGFRESGDGARSVEWSPWTSGVWKGHVFGLRKSLLWSWLRLLAGIVLPLFLWWQGGNVAAWFAVLAVALGAAIDRAEFYDELEPMTPHRQMQEDLAAEVVRNAGSPHV